MQVLARRALTLVYTDSYRDANKDGIQEDFQAVIKSAASAASLHGFSSRDQVGCSRSLPADQKILKKYEKMY